MRVLRCKHYQPAAVQKGRTFGKQVFSKTLLKISQHWWVGSTSEFGWLILLVVVTPRGFFFWKKTLPGTKTFRPPPRNLGRLFRRASWSDCAAGLSQSESKFRSCRTLNCVVLQKQSNKSSKRKVSRPGCEKNVAIQYYCRCTGRCGSVWWPSCSAGSFQPPFRCIGRVEMIFSSPLISPKSPLSPKKMRKGLLLDGDQNFKFSIFGD